MLSRMALRRFLMRRLSHISGAMKPMPAPATASIRPMRQVAADEADEQEPQPRDGTRHDHLEAKEVDGAHVVGIAGHGQP